MKKVLSVILFLVALSWAGTIAFAQSAALSPDSVPRMTIEELKAKLGSPDLVIVDVRTTYQWQQATTKIKGAVREEYSQIGSWIDKYPKDKTLVFY